jgi:tripartite-type tricarboxylate transporter receptor subunit TctC
MKHRYARAARPARRRLLAAAAGVAALGVPAAGRAQAYPSRPIRLLVPYASGGVVDVMARAVTQRMQVDLGQPIVVEAKPGANGNIAADQVAIAPADGYMLIVSAPFIVANPMLENGLRWKPADFVPVARYALSPSYFVVPANSPAKTMKEYVELARRAPAPLQYGDGGTGSTQSMAIEMLKATYGLKLEPVMYKGAPPIIPDLIAGTLSMSLIPSTVAIPHIRSGKLRALANSSGKRAPMFPDIPTVAEAGFPEVTVESWYGLHAPAGTPADVIRRLSDACGAACATDEVRERLAAAGGEAAFLATPEFVAFLKEEQVRWPRFVEAAKKNAR